MIFDPRNPVLIGNDQSSRKAHRPILGVLGLTLLSLFCTHHCVADELVSTVVERPFQPPNAFFKPVPETVDELKAMQDYLRRVSPSLIAATVGVRIGRSQGSGVIVSKEGIVLTAAHVGGAPDRYVEIILPDNTVVRGRTGGRNRVLDASIIHITEERKNWPFVPLAPKDEVKLGDWCIATGHPGGHQPQRKPVLRLGRVFEKTPRDIRTDCELVGGDSGGPLFDVRGRVIGIHSHIEDKLNSNWHVLVDVYHEDWNKLTTDQDFSARSGALLGVSGKSREEGLELTEVFPGQPADEAGLKVGDIIVLFDQKRVKTLQELIDDVQAEFPGKAVHLQILRDGKSQDTKVRLALRG